MNLLSVVLAFLTTQSSLAQTVTQAQFEALGEKIVALYSRELTAADIPMYAAPDWSSREVHAQIGLRQFPYLTLNYTGGFIKRNRNSLDALSLVICHEMGHVLGNRPKGDPRALAAEGEADYFATRDCLPRLWKDQSTVPAVALPGAEAEAIGFLGLSSLKIRILAAAYEATVKNIAPVSYRTKATEVKKTTDYPSAQCRLDTYLAGVLKQKRPSCWHGK